MAHTIFRSFFSQRWKRTILLIAAMLVTSLTHAGAQSTPQLFPNGLPDNIEALDEVHRLFVRKVFPGDLSATDAARGIELINAHRAALTGQTNGESAQVVFEACEDFVLPASLRTFKDVTFQLPKILQDSAEITLAMVTSDGVLVVPVQQLSKFSIKISVPLHPAGRNSGDAHFVLMDENGWNENGVRCAPKPVQITPPKVASGAYLDMLLTTAKHLKETHQFAQVLNFPTPFSEDALKTALEAMAEDWEIYEAMLPDEQWVFDALYSASSPIGGALQQSAQAHSDMRDFLLAKPRKTAQIQEQFGDAAFILAAAPDELNFDIGLTPFSGQQSTRVPFVDVCPRDAAELNQMAELAARGRVRGLSDVKIWFTASQITAGVSARLFVMAAGGNSTEAEAADRLVNAMGARYFLIQDYYAGMFPSQFVKLDAELSDHEVFEDSAPTAKIFIDRIDVHTRSDGYDLAKAGLDMGLLVAGAAGKSFVNGGKIASKVSSNLAAGQFGKLTRAGLSIKELMGKADTYYVAKQVFDFTAGNIIGAAEGEAIGQLYGLQKGDSKQFEIDPIECIVDIIDEEYSQVSLTERDPGNFIINTSHVEYGILNKGSVKFVIEPQRLDSMFWGAKGQPKKEIFYQVPSIAKFTYAPISVRGGESGVIKTELFDTSGAATIEWKSESGLGAFSSSNGGKTINFTAEANDSCEDKLVYISGQYVSPTWLQNSTAPDDSLSISFVILPDKPDDECEEEEPEEEILIEPLVCALYPDSKEPYKLRANSSTAPQPGIYRSHYVSFVHYQKQYRFHRSRRFEHLQDRVSPIVQPLGRSGDSYYFVAHTHELGQFRYQPSGMNFTQLTDNFIGSATSLPGYPPFSDFGCLREFIETLKKSNPPVFEWTNPDGIRNGPFLFAHGRDLFQILAFPFTTSLGNPKQEKMIHVIHWVKMSDKELLSLDKEEQFRLDLDVEHLEKSLSDAGCEDDPDIECPS